jgi:hypothetical protein
MSMSRLKGIGQTLGRRVVSLDFDVTRQRDKMRRAIRRSNPESDGGWELLRGTQRDGKRGRSISDTDKGTIARINREQLLSSAGRTRHALMRKKLLLTPLALIGHMPPHKNVDAIHARRGKRPNHHDTNDTQNNHHGRNLEQGHIHDKPPHKPGVATSYCIVAATTHTPSLRRRTSATKRAFFIDM